jgi:Tol biopolymer transport system component
MQSPPGVYRTYSYAILAALLASVIACSDSSGPMTSSRPVASVAVTPTTVVLEEGATRPLAAVAFDADENVLTGRTVQWSTDAPSVATVSASGLVSATAQGYAVITATVEGKSSSSAVTVVEPEPMIEYDLVYERRPFDGSGEIRRVSLANGASTPLPLVATIPGTFVRDVTPSPDGTRVAFTVAWYPENVSTMDGDIYVANIDGGNRRRLTTTAELDEQPAWSPDGSRIAFRSKRSGDWDIWVMAADGTGQVNLMGNILPATSTDHTPAWSPDGSRIVYSSDIDNFAYAKLWTMRPDGGDKRRLLPQAGGTTDIDREPSWSPEGSRIAFRRIGGGGFGSEIMIATVATGTVTRIELDGVQAFPSWSPDGSLIAFASNHQYPLAHVYTMKPDGTDINRHTAGSDEHTYPRWVQAQPAQITSR